MDFLGKLHSETLCSLVTLHVWLKPLLSGAKSLVKAIEKSIRKGKYSQKFFKRHYELKIKRSIGAQLKVHYFIRLILVNLTDKDFNQFFKIYKNTGIQDVFGKYADMDFPLRMMLHLLFNRHFIRFIVHIVFRNMKLLPTFLHDIAL